MLKDIFIHILIDTIMITTSEVSAKISNIPHKNLTVIKVIHVQKTDQTITGT